MRLYIGFMFEYINSLESVRLFLWNKYISDFEKTFNMNYTIRVLYSDRSFYALITGVSDDLIWRICAIIQLLTNFDSNTLLSFNLFFFFVFVCLAKGTRNKIGESH